MNNVIPIHSESIINFYADKAISANTKINKDCDWKLFNQFCSRYNYSSLPASSHTVAFYIATQAKENHAYATIKRRLSTISSKHIDNKLPNPTTDHNVREVLDGIKNNDKKMGLSTPKSAIQANDLKLIIEAIDDSTLRGKRDKIIMLLLFASGNRRSELVSLNVENVKFISKGIIITTNLTKTHSLKEKAIKYAHNKYCPVVALKEWLESANISEGAIFCSIDRFQRVGSRLTTKSIEKLIKHYAEKIGLDPSLYAGHSFRRGNATFADKQGIRESDLNSFIGWNTNMAARYKEADRLFDNEVSGIMSLLE